MDADEVCARWDAPGHAPPPCGPFSLRRSILAWTYVVLLLIVSAQIGRIFLYR